MSSLVVSVLIFFFAREIALEQLQQLACAPSVQMQDVPRESLRQHLGFGRDDEEGRDELDEKLARKCPLLTSVASSLSTFILWH